MISALGSPHLRGSTPFPIRILPPSKPPFASCATLAHSYIHVLARASNLQQEGCRVGFRHLRNPRGRRPRRKQQGRRVSGHDRAPRRHRRPKPPRARERRVRILHRHPGPRCCISRCSREGPGMELGPDDVRGGDPGEGCASGVHKGAFAVPGSCVGRLEERGAASHTSRAVVPALWRPLSHAPCAQARRWAQASPSQKFPRLRCSGGDAFTPNPRLPGRGRCSPARLKYRATGHLSCPTLCRHGPIEVLIKSVGAIVITGIPYGDHAAATHRHGIPRVFEGISNHKASRGRETW